MAEISIAKIKIRRGLDSQRKQVILDQGELGYTLDTKRLFVGTGSLEGGHVLGAKVHTPMTVFSALTGLNSERGDIVSVSNKLYQLTLDDYSNINSWTYIGTRADNSTISYNTSERLQIKDGGVTGIKLNANVAGDGLSLTSNKLKINYKTSQFNITSGVLGIKPGAITNTEISSSILSLSGGLSRDGEGKVFLQVGTGLTIDGNNTLQVDAIVNSSIADNSITVNKFNSNVAGTGINLTGNKINVDYSTTYFSISNSKLILQPNSVDLNEISTNITSVSGGVNFLDDGIGLRVGEGLNVDGTNTLILTGIPPNFTVTYDYVDPSLIGDGLYLDSVSETINTTFQTVNTTSFFISSGQLNLSLKTPPSGVEMPFVEYDDYGMPTTITSSIYDAITGVLGSLSGDGATMFNGYPGQRTSETDNNSVHTYQCYSSDLGVVTLSSAGFITFEGGNGTRGTGEQVDRYAIPIFTF